jgi:hypothetical protein
MAGRWLINIWNLGTTQNRSGQSSLIEARVSGLFFIEDILFGKVYWGKIVKYYSAGNCADSE